MFAIRTIKSLRFFRDDRNCTPSESNLTANTTFSIEDSLKEGERNSSGKTPGEGGRKERSLGFKVAINPLWPFLKPFGARVAASLAFTRLYSSISSLCIPHPRIHPRPFFSGLFPDRNDIRQRRQNFYEYDCKRGEPRKIDFRNIIRANIKSEMGEHHIITKILDKITETLYFALQFFNMHYLICNNVLILYSHKSSFYKKKI